MAPYSKATHTQSIVYYAYDIQYNLLGFVSLSLHIMRLFILILASFVEFSHRYAPTRAGDETDQVVAL